MPEIELIPENDMPAAMRELFARARRKELTPEEFYKELSSHGITGFIKVLYTSRAFDLPLNQVKVFYINEQHGSIDAWAGELQKALGKVNDDQEF
jgi:hypothetical protein